MKKNGKKFAIFANLTSSLSIIITSSVLATTSIIKTNYSSSLKNEDEGLSLNLQDNQSEISNAKENLKALTPSSEQKTYLLYGNTYNKEEYFKYGNYAIDSLIGRESSVPSYISSDPILKNMRVSLIGFLDKRAVINFYYLKTKTNWAIVLDHSSTNSILNKNYSWDKIHEINVQAAQDFFVVLNDFDVTKFTKIDQGFIVTPKARSQKKYHNEDDVKFHGSMWEGRHGDSGNGEFDIFNLDMDAISESLKLVYEFDSGKKDLNVTKVVPYLRYVTIVPKIYIYDDPVTCFSSSYTINYTDNLGQGGSASSSTVEHDVPSSNKESSMYFGEQLMSLMGLGASVAGFFFTGGAIAPAILAAAGTWLSAASLAGTIMEPKETALIHGSRLTTYFFDYLYNFPNSKFNLKFSGNMQYFGSGDSQAFFGEWSGARISDFDIYLEFGLKGEYVR